MPTYLRIIDNSNKPAPTPPCGNQFLTQLHQLTGAFIVANPNPTGNSERGGTWKLTSSIPPSPTQPKLALTETALKTYSGILGLAPKVDFPTGMAPISQHRRLQRRRFTRCSCGEHLQQHHLHPHQHHPHRRHHPHLRPQSRLPHWE
jgi:hypothetical protein